MGKEKFNKEKKDIKDKKDKKRKRDEEGEKGEKKENSSSSLKQLINKERKRIGKGGEHIFKEVSAKLYIHLSPAQLSDLFAGIDVQLNKYLLKYNESMGGVVISYSDVEVLQRCGKILYDNPFIHFYIAAKFLVFSPSIGSNLVGTVNKVSQGHIGLLVYGVFNASISSDLLSVNYSFNESGTGWIDREDPDRAIEVGSEVSFNVKEIETVNDIITIFGTLQGESTGLISNFMRSSSEQSSTPKTPLNQEENRPPTVSSGKRKNSIDVEKISKKRKPEETSHDSDQDEAAPVSAKKRKLDLDSSKKIKSPIKSQSQSPMKSPVKSPTKPSSQEDDSNEKTPKKKDGKDKKEKGEKKETVDKKEKKKEKDADKVETQETKSKPKEKETPKTKKEKDQEATKSTSLTPKSDKKKSKKEE